MYEKLIMQLAKRPKEYAPSSAAFWDDPHISKGMLDAHLDDTVDGATRNRDFVKKSAQWIAEITEAKKQKTLLDLGCGPGIYAELFADLEFVVTGIDFSSRSINYAQSTAKKNKKQITYHYQNYLEIAYENEFDVITLIYCDFGVLSPENRQKLLQKIRKALKPNGYFIMDAYASKFFVDFTESQHIEYKECGYWSSEPYVCFQQNFRYDKTNTFLEQYHVITTNAIERYALWNHSFEQNEMIRLLEHHGFSNIRLFGDIAGNPYSSDSSTLCVVCKKV